MAIDEYEIRGALSELAEVSVTDPAARARRLANRTTQVGGASQYPRRTALCRPRAGVARLGRGRLAGIERDWNLERRQRRENPRRSRGSRPSGRPDLNRGPHRPELRSPRCPILPASWCLRGIRQSGRSKVRSDRAPIRPDSGTRSHPVPKHSIVTPRTDARGTRTTDGERSRRRRSPSDSVEQSVCHRVLASPVGRSVRISRRRAGSITRPFEPFDLGLRLARREPVAAVDEVLDVRDQIRRVDPEPEEPGQHLVVDPGAHALGAAPVDLLLKDCRALARRSWRRQSVAARDRVRVAGAPQVRQRQRRSMPRTGSRCSASPPGGAASPVRPTVTSRRPEVPTTTARRFPA